jgi:hypothetical protein
MYFVFNLRLSAFICGQILLACRVFTSVVRSGHPLFGQTRASSCQESKGVHFMPKEAHTSAAYHHERAAKSHRAAAQQTSIGAHDACQEHADSALEHSTKADEATRLAHAKSAQNVKQVPVLAK